MTGDLALGFMSGIVITLAIVITYMELIRWRR
jgi:hypothetical protein